MGVIVLQVFVSLMLVISSVVFLVVSIAQGDHEHVDRLSLKPLDDDEGTTSSSRCGEDKRS